MIGVGGGYDIVVAAMLRERCQKIECGKDIAVGGFLNPKFDHFFKSENIWNKEQPSNFVVAAQKFRRIAGTSERSMEEYLVDPSTPPIPFVDNSLRQYLRCPVYNFSLKYPAEATACFLAENFDGITFCDIGGDVLFFGSNDNMVKTPIIDAYAMRVAKLYYEMTGKRCVLQLLGLGFDGELTYKSLDQNMRWLVQQEAVLSVESLTQEDILYLEKVYMQVKSGDKGHTNQLLIDIWRFGNLADSTIVRKRNIMAFQQWFNQIISVDAIVVAENNPLCTCGSAEEMKACALRLGVKLEG
jgi:hypothetical protein